MEKEIKLVVDCNAIGMIGNTTCNDNGFTTFICDSKTANVEVFLLKYILQCFGDYEVLSENDFVWENDNVDIEVKTNLPWDMFNKVMEVVA